MQSTRPAPATALACKRCGTQYTAEEVSSGQAFRLRPDGMHLVRPVCRPCEETEGDGRKGADRWGPKANDTTKSHAIKLAKPRKGACGDTWHDPDLTKEALISHYGWDQKQLAHDAEFQYNNGCSYCHHPYKGMGHGLADITIDIYDPRLPPDYSNTRWCCMTCQRRKGLLTPERWAIKQRIYRKWAAAKALSADERGMLFDLGEG